MYKVFCNDSELIFASVNENWESVLYYDDYKVIEDSKPDEEFLKKRFAKKKKKSYVFLYKSGVVEAWKSFITPMKHLKAGGGIVKNKQDQTLVIFRKGKWDLPKGKLDAGETEEEGAIREIIEETGVTVEIVHHQPIYTYHIYKLKQRIILKRTAWFHMSSIDDAKMAAQEEEGITEVKWFSSKEMREEFLLNTYPTIKVILS